MFNLMKLSTTTIAEPSHQEHNGMIFPVEEVELTEKMDFMTGFVIWQECRWLKNLVRILLLAAFDGLYTLVSKNVVSKYKMLILFSLIIQTLY